MSYDLKHKRNKSMNLAKRKCVKVLLLNENNELLMIHVEDPKTTPDREPNRSNENTIEKIIAVLTPTIGTK